MLIGFIGTGKMGSRMVERLLDKKHNVIVYARHPKSSSGLNKRGALVTNDYAEFASRLGKKKIIFLMVPHGKPVDDVLQGISKFLSQGDIVIDGGNSFFKDTIRRGKKPSKKEVHYLDAGISGGLEGARNGASIMVGGNKKAFKAVERLFRDMAVKNGYALMGGSGAGHFVKMIHNGIEYAWLQSAGEGFGMLEKSNYNLDMREVTKVYSHGSVIRGWLMDLLYDAFRKDPGLKKQSGVIGGGSTGTWNLKTAREMRLRFKTLEVAMAARKNSFRKPDFSTKVVAVLRHGFGGHDAPKKSI